MPDNPTRWPHTEESWKSKYAGKAIEFGPITVTGANERNRLKLVKAAKKTKLIDELLDITQNVKRGGHSLLNQLAAALFF